MKFSIIVPIYNKENFLSQCIESIQQQSYGDFECILVDDGSKDASGRIAKNVTDIDSRFVYVYKENGGLVSARKAGAIQARGEYIINIDADDYVQCDFLQRINDEIVRNKPDTVCINYTILRDGKFIANDSEQICGCYENKELEDLLDHYLFDDRKPYINSGSVMFNVCTKAVKREIYIACQEKVHNSITSGEDTTFSFLWCFSAKKVCIIPYAGYVYRSDDSSIEHTFNVKNFYNLKLVCDELRKINASKSAGYQNNINAYQVYRLERYIYLLAQAASSWKSFKKEIKTLESEIPSVFENNVKNSFNLNNMIRYMVVKFRMWSIMYILGRTRYKGRLY